MPRVSFGAENKVATTNYDYPKLKLKNGERARIIVGLEDPLVEYVHTLRKPQIVNGQPQIFKAERKDGTTYDDYKMDFISRPICLGDATILDEKGSDPKNCPMCKLALDYGDYGQPPQRRYAMHVIRYRTKGGTTDIQTPFSVEVLIWSFTDKTFNKISDFKEEWGDLRKHDLLLGPCTNETFQQFDITVAAKAEWLASEERKKLTALTFKENQIPDLTIAAGSVKQKQWVEQDIQAILEAWGQVHGSASEEDTTGLDEDLGNLLGGGEEKWADGKTEKEVAAAKKSAAAKKAPDPEPEAEEEEPNAISDDAFAGLDEFTADSTSNPEPEEEAEEEKPAPKKAPAKKPAAKPDPEPEEESTEDVDNFDDLLADLN